MRYGNILRPYGLYRNRQAANGPLLGFQFFVSITSWVIFFCTSAIAIYYMARNKDINFIWLIMRVNPDISENYYFPILMQSYYLMILFALVILICFAKLLYMLHIILDGDEEIYNTYYGGCTKLHFIPLLIMTGLNFYGIALNEELERNEWHLDKFMNSYYALANLVVSSITVILMEIILYRTTFGSFSDDLIHRATFSCFIPLLVYNIMYS